MHHHGCNDEQKRNLCFHGGYNLELTSRQHCPQSWEEEILLFACSLPQLTSSCWPPSSQIVSSFAFIHHGLCTEQRLPVNRRTVVIYLLRSLNKCPIISRCVKKDSSSKGEETALCNKLSKLDNQVEISLLRGRKVLLFCLPRGVS